MNNKTPTKQLVLAIGLSLLFLIPYMYFFSPKPTQMDSNATKTAESKLDLNATNNINTAPNIASNASIAQSQNAPTTERKSIANVDLKNIKLGFDELGRINSAKLLEKKYLQDGAPLELLSTKEILPLEIRFSNPTINEKAFKIPYSAQIEGNKITLTQNLGEIENMGEITIKKILNFKDDLSYDLKIELNKPLDFYISNGARPVADTNAYVFKGVIIKKSDETLEKIEDGDANIGENLKFSKAFFVSSVDRYYASLFFSENGLEVVTDTNEQENALPYVFLQNSAELKGYIGPKNYQDLKAINPLLTDVVEYGVITFFAKPLFLLLEWLFNIFLNWGWAIVVLTLIVRVILFPLSYKGMISMQKLKDLAPKMKDIQTKYKGDSQKLQLHMMELYKKHKVNPMGGCLPLLLQIPVFFAIYRVLYNAVELKDAAWLLWIHDLSVMDPYFILPIIMGATMYYQQHLTPATFNDPMQEKVFKFLPLIFTLFLITFPAGLVLYWTVNNVFSIIQQLIINKIMENKKQKEGEESSVKN